jgi:hypothetical protein
MLAWSLTIDWICVFPTPSNRAMAIAVSPFLLLLTTSNLSSSVSIFLFLERKPEASQVLMPETHSLLGFQQFKFAHAQRDAK